MISLNASFLAALEKGSGQQIFYITLQSLSGAAGPGTPTDEGTFNVMQAVLSRSRVDVFVKENLLTAGLIDSPLGSTWAVKVTRGLTIAGTAYTVTTNQYFISEVNYTQELGTHIIADLLPTTSLVGIDGGQTAQAVLEDAFSQFMYPATIYFGGVGSPARDIWYAWQFYATGEVLSLKDGRALEALIQEKYYSYFFPRDGSKLFVYGIPTNETNNQDGTYTPFSHAITKIFLTPEKPTNLTWYSETGYQEYILDASYGYKSLGFIADADDPSADSDFQNWGTIYDGYMYEYRQRPDLRLEQGDLLKVSTDSFTKARCFELIEVFKQGGDPAWYQIVRQLPFHPRDVEAWHPIPTWPIPEPFGTVIQSSNFSGVLSLDDSNIQQALNKIDVHEHDIYIEHALATAENDFLAGSGAGGTGFIKKTLAQVKTILGLGSAAYTASTDYAIAAKGVTNGDSHDHAGGDGAQIDHGGLAGLSDDDHTQYIRHNLCSSNSDFLVGNANNPTVPVFEKKTLAETRAILKTNEFQLRLNDHATAIAVANNQQKIIIPARLNGLNLTACEASRQGSNGVLQIMIRNLGISDMLSSPLQIDDGDTGSWDSASPVTIDTSNDDVATHEILVVDVDAVGTNNYNVVVWLQFG